MNWRSVFRSLPVIGPLSYRIRPRRTHSFQTNEPFRGSNDYWERRYAQGGTSGAGSYDRLALFKAEVVNDVVRRLAINSVIEFGCGDGAQLELAEYPAYIGIDVSKTVLEKVRQKFSRRPNFRFFHASEAQGLRAELSLSLDVIYHLIEDEVFEDYMRDLFQAGTKMVVIYSSNEVASTDVSHVRHRRFTDWVEKNCRSFQLIETIPNRYPFDPDNPDQTSFADFYIYRALNAKGRNS